MQDQVLTCQQCGNEFVWSKEEQLIYKERGLSSPKYCPICRGMLEAERRFQKSRDKNK